MKRFITVSLALFLGLIHADSSPANPPAPGAEIKSKFADKIEDLNEDLQRINCILYDDLTFFDLRSLEQYNPLNVTNNDIVANPTPLSYNLNFCKRFIYTGEDNTEYKTFVYVDYGVNRVALTDSGKPSYTETVLKSGENEDTHIKFVQDGGAACKEKSDNAEGVNYKVTYEVLCNATVTGRP